MPQCTIEDSPDILRNPGSFRLVSSGKLHANFEAVEHGPMGAIGQLKLALAMETEITHFYLDSTDAL